MAEKKLGKRRDFWNTRFNSHSGFINTSIWSGDSSSKKQTPGYKDKRKKK